MASPRPPRPPDHAAGRNGHELAKRVIVAADAGFPLTSTVLQRVAVGAAKEMGVGGFVASHMWASGFPSRHPDIVKRTAKNTAAARLARFNRVSWHEWVGVFKDLSAAYSPKEIFNTDDKGWDLTNINR